MGVGVCLCGCLHACVSACVYVCVFVCLFVSVIRIIVKCPVLPPCAVDGHSRNPFYYDIIIIIMVPFSGSRWWERSCQCCRCQRGR